MYVQQPSFVGALCNEYNIPGILSLNESHSYLQVGPRPGPDSCSRLVGTSYFTMYPKLCRRVYICEGVFYLGS